MTFEPDHIRPFHASRPSGPVFVGLNVLRLLSVAALLLLLAANAVTMATDLKAIRNSSSAGDNISSGVNSTVAEDWDCDYVEYSTVPDQAGGAFWSVLNRVFIILETILLTLSEFDFPKRLFNEFIPVLGPAHGLGCLGVLQATIAASVLSHYCDLFPQVSSWLLFIVGCLNMTIGVFLRSSAKTKRSLFKWESTATLTPQSRLPVTAWEFVDVKRENPFTATARTSNTHTAPLVRSESLSATPLPSERIKGSGASIGSFGFGKQADRVNADRGCKISRPLQTLPKYAS